MYVPRWRTHRYLVPTYAPNLGSRAVVGKKNLGQKKDFNHLDGGKPGVHYTWHDRNEPRVRKWTWSGPGPFSGSCNKRAPTQQSTKSPSFCPLLVASGLLLQKHKLLLAPSLSHSSVSQFFLLRFPRENRTCNTQRIAATIPALSERNSSLLSDSAICFCFV